MMNQVTNIKLLGSCFNCIFFHFISKLNTKDPYKNRFGLHMLRPSSGSQHEISGAHYLPTLNHMTLKSILKLDISLFVAIAADDGLGSNASIVKGSDEDDLDQLLRTPNSDVVSSRDKTLTPGRDSF